MQPRVLVLTLTTMYDLRALAACQMSETEYDVSWASESGSGVLNSGLSSLRGSKQQWGRARCLPRRVLPPSPPPTRSPQFDQDMEELQFASIPIPNMRKEKYGR